MTRLLNKIALFTLPRIWSFTLRILGRTWRYTSIQQEHVEGVLSEGKPIIYALWHGRMLPLIYMYRNRKIHALVSQHRDGELASRTAIRLGFGTVRGSSTRGGTKGSQELLNKLTAGFDIAIMPDGPKGPPRKAQLGILRLAQLSGCPIVPVTAGASRYYTLRSWDSFIIPKPFARCAIMWSDPIHIPPKASSDLLEEKRMTLEKNLNTITNETDSLFN